MVFSKRGTGVCQRVACQAEVSAWRTATVMAVWSLPFSSQFLLVSLLALQSLLEAFRSSGGEGLEAQASAADVMVKGSAAGLPLVY